MSRNRLAAAELLEQTARAREAAQATKLAAQEAQLRETLKGELARERQRFEAEFAKSAAEIAQARQDQVAAEAAKAAAAEEAQTIIAEYRATQARQAFEMAQKLTAERTRIAADAERLRLEMLNAVRDKEAAEAARVVAEQELSAARLRQSSSQQTEQNLRAEIELLEAHASAAASKLVDAVAATSVAESRQRENAEQLQRAQQPGSGLSSLLKKELEEWVEEQDRMQNSTAQRKD
ncbi:MAG: hypothetical protein EXR86_02210 [Gammaproteobacteria bacterium]|nr:hypothetical protein [Gammaproteobacteria bacterium]